MKPLSLFVFGFLFLLPVAQATDTDRDFSRYEMRTDFTVGGITTPKVVQFRTQLDTSGGTVLLDSEGELVRHQWRRSTESVSEKDVAVTAVSSAFAGEPDALIDGDMKTTFLFAPDQTGPKSVTFTFPEKTEVSGIYTFLDDDIFAPQSMTVLADFGDGKLLPLIDETDFIRRQAFSKMFVKRLQVQYTTPHVLRLKEIQLLTQAEVLRFDDLIFFAEEGAAYTLYWQPHFGQKRYWAKSSQPLRSDDKTPTFDLPAGERNQNFNNDYDDDGIADRDDLCPTVNDPDNTDADQNGRGDQCEDPDLDNYPSHKDNCPFTYNPDQADIDQDGQGDTCDDEENRMTETHGNFLWFVFGLAGILLIFLVWRSLKPTS